jgi:hypothetical protein
LTPVARRTHSTTRVDVKPSGLSITIQPFGLGLTDIVVFDFIIRGVQIALHFGTGQ